MSRIAKTLSSAAKPDATFQQGVLELIPFLRAFSRSLCGNRDLADDLAQEALIKAWQARASLRAGSNLKVWLFTILHNQFYSDQHQAWRQAPLDEGTAECIPSANGKQTRAVELPDTMRALRGLPDKQREALILVGAAGFSYGHAAAICNCPLGTAKSRVTRARRALIGSLDGNGQLEPRASTSAKEDASREIMTQLDRLAPIHARDAA